MTLHLSPHNLAWPECAGREGAACRWRHGLRGCTTIVPCLFLLCSVVIHQAHVQQSSGSLTEATPDSSASSAGPPATVATPAAAAARRHGSATATARATAESRHACLRAGSRPATAACGGIAIAIHRGVWGAARQAGSPCPAAAANWHNAVLRGIVVVHVVLRQQILVVVHLCHRSCGSRCGLCARILLRVLGQQDLINLVVGQLLGHVAAGV
mmetsp:Transcript_12911/g.39040  ORF Transcript_12911/g.39040 Transcript_12911/m.39040 type:complete len:213 (-) Transcript_12911:604-1242(-)